jgi:hypothetical protein
MYPLLNNLLILAWASATVFAGPHDTNKSLPSVPVWPASNFVWGCSPGGCSAQFNLTAADNYYPGIQGFDVLCSPIFIQQPWVPCRQTNGSELPPGLRVETIWTDGPDRDKMYLGASHIYTSENGTLLNATSRVELTRVMQMEDFDFPVLSPGEPVEDINGKDN